MSPLPQLPLAAIGSPTEIFNIQGVALDSNARRGSACPELRKSALLGTTAHSTFALVPVYTVPAGKTFAIYPPMILAAMLFT